MVTMPSITPSAPTREHGEVVALRGADRCLPVLRRRQGRHGAVHDLGDDGLGLGPEESPHRQDSLDVARLIGHVDHVDGLRLTTFLTDVIECLAYGPRRPNGHEVRCHEPANALLGIAEEHPGLLHVLGAQQTEESLCDLARQLLQELGSIVRRHVRQDVTRLVLREITQQRRLLVGLQVREDLRGVISRERPERHGSFGCVQLAKEVHRLWHSERGKRFPDHFQVAGGDPGPHVLMLDRRRHDLPPLRRCGRRRERHQR
jgi:hypothetical protein